MNHTKSFTIFLFQLLTLTTLAQGTQLDSLKAALPALKDDTVKANMLNKLAEILWKTEPAEAIAYATEAKYISEDLNYLRGLGASYQTIGLGYFVQGNYLECLKNFDRSLEYYETLGEPTSLNRSLNTHGTIYSMLGEYTKSVQLYHRGLSIAEDTRDFEMIGSFLLNLGKVYSTQHARQDSANYYFKKALYTGETRGDMDLIGLSIINLGEMFYKRDAYDSALHYFDKSLSVISANVDFSISLDYLGRIYAEKGDYQTAIQYHRDALDMARAQNSSIQLLQILLSVATTYYKQGTPRMAIDYYDQAKSLAEKLGSNSILSDAYEGLATSYAILSDFELAYIYSSRQSQLLKANNKIESDHAAYLISLYKSLEKEKEAEIDILEQQSIIEQLKGKRQRILNITTVSIGFLLLLIAAGLLHRFIYIRKTNGKIRLQKSEIEAQRDLLIKQKKDITDSINYAQRIQEALLPSRHYIEDLLSEYFIIYRPRDIVSGDFYWIKELGNHQVFIGADCTGHGVPGGFMSMLGVTLLNDLICPENLERPNEVLGQLRHKIKEMLTQNGRIEEQKDGMDMAIAILNKSTRQLRYAGANHPLYLIRNNGVTDNGLLASYLSIQNNNYSLFEIKGDNQPIGVHWEENGFQTHVIELKEQDVFYIFSDGIIDQYGGEHRKRFKTINFKKLLLSIQMEPMESQKKRIEETFVSWKGNHEQIDDVCVIGVRI